MVLEPEHLRIAICRQSHYRVIVYSTKVRTTPSVKIVWYLKNVEQNRYNIYGKNINEEIVRGAA